MWDIHRTSATCLARQPVRVPASRPRHRYHSRRRLAFDPLEGRALLSLTTWTVNSLGDAGTGSGTSGDLRYVITQADQTTGNNTINFAVTGTITLNSALPDLSNTTGLTDIEGPGSASLTVARNSASGTPDFRIFTVDTNAIVKFVGLTIAGGLSDTDGGGIFNTGTVTLIDSTVSDNSTSVLGVWTNFGGGGIYNSGAMTLTDSTVIGNSTTEDWADGGGIYNSGAVTFDNSIVSDNSAAAYYGLAGGIYNSGTVTLTDSTVSDNSTTGNYGMGGGIYNSPYGTLILTASTVVGNSTAGIVAGGGGIYLSNSTAILTDSTVVGNRTTGFNSLGGGLYTESGSTLSLNDSTVVNNSTSAQYASGGGIFNSGTMTLTNSAISGNSTVGYNAPGGGIFNYVRVTLINSSVSDNSTTGDYSSGGGIYNATGGNAYSVGTMTLINSSVGGNSTAGDWADGGGIYNQSFYNPSSENFLGSLTLTNTTVGDNRTAGNWADGGGIFNEGVVTLTYSTVSGNSTGGIGSYGGGIVSASLGGVFVMTTIIAGNSAPLCPDGSGQFLSQGYNLIGNTDGSTGWGANDLLNVDPMLGPLQDNGSPTMTMALLPGSPAIDAGIPVQGITTDQRGVPRTQGPEPDIGAYESQYLTAFDLLASPTITYGTAAVTLTGQITAGTQIPTGSVAITLNGTTQWAAIDPSTCKFSAVFTSSALHVSSSPYRLTYSYAGGNGVYAATAIRSLWIAPAILTIAALDQTAAFGSDPPVLTVSYHGFVNGDGVAASPNRWSCPRRPWPTVPRAAMRSSPPGRRRPTT